MVMRFISTPGRVFWKGSKAEEPSISRSRSLADEDALQPGIIHESFIQPCNAGDVSSAGFVRSGRRTPQSQPELLSSVMTSSQNSATSPQSRRSPHR